MESRRKSRWSVLIVFCLWACALGAQSSPSNLSELSSEDRTSIEAACSTAKFVYGPAAYHACLQKQLGALSGSTIPDPTPVEQESSTSATFTPQPNVPTPTASGTSLCAENGSCYGDLNANGVAKTVHVNGYYRKDGTYVRGHYRSAPGTNPRKK